MAQDRREFDRRTVLRNTAAALGVTAGTASAADSPAIATGDATDVGNHTATLHYDLTDLGGADSVDVFFEYGESGTTLDQTSTTWTISTTTSSSIDVDGLTAGTTYDYRAVAEASDGDSDTGSILGFTTLGPPSIDQFSLTDDSNKTWSRVTVDWAISDGDGDLDSVSSELLDGSTVVDSATSDVSGSDASGTHDLEHKGAADAVRLSVADAAGNVTTETKSL